MKGKKRLGIVDYILKYNYLEAKLDIEILQVNSQLQLTLTVSEVRDYLMHEAADFQKKGSFQLNFQLFSNQLVDQILQQNFFNVENAVLW